MRIHFIGIGGIGVSALAQYYLVKGHQISGSDLALSEITKSLEKLGAKIFIGKHEAKNLPKNTDKIIYSPAVKKDNPELKAVNVGCRTSNIEILSYPEALGELTKKYFTIAVSGTHGKSTTTAMIGLILVKARLDPTVIVGTKLKEFGNSNCRVGKGKYLVIEACEHEESFLNYFPDIAVITNIEAEHLDYFKNFNNVKKAFGKFAKKLKKNGILITEKEYKNIRDFKKLKKILKVPGEHNVANALAALTVARSLKISDKISFKALSEYKGSWRRFEITKILDPTLHFCSAKMKVKPCTLINDYAHHPTEIKVTLKAAREKYPKKEIWCVFQPHQYQRTFYLFDDFVKVFKEALRPVQGKASINKLIITDIYDVAGREEKEIKGKISSEKLVKRIMNYESRIKTIVRPSFTHFSNIIFIPTVKKAAQYLKKNLKGGEVVIGMGAGDIYKLTDTFST